MTDTSVYEVYLVDPGAHASHVITLIQEVTQLGTAECAALVHDTPARIAVYSSREAAEDLAARFREFDALAIVRRPGEKAPPEPPPLTVVPAPRAPMGIGLIALGVLQLGLAGWWLLQPPAGGGQLLLPGIGGLLLGLLTLLAGVWKLRGRELD